VTIPLPVTEEVSVLPAVLLVVEGERVLFSDVSPSPLSGPGEEAREIELAIGEASRAAGYRPDRVLVRHAAVAAALSSPGMEVSAAEVLPGIDFMAADLLDTMAALPPLPPLASPETWGGWGLPAVSVAEIFRAGAEFYRAAPWEVFSDEELIGAELPGGRGWAACVLGGGEVQYGLVLYEEVEDYLGMLTASGPEDAFEGLRGIVLSLSFEPRLVLPRSMVREIRRAKWEVASPAAYPHLTVLNPAGPGLAPEDAADLAVLLGAIARHVGAGGSDTDRGAGLAPVWVDPESGAVLRHMQVEAGQEESLWSPPAVLRPACAEGPGAEPGAALQTPDDPDVLAAPGEALAGRFGEWLARTGVSRGTVDKHLFNAGVFVEYLVRWEGVPVPAVTEFDLRVFLYDWYLRKVHDTRTRVLAMPTSLRRFFTFLAEEEGISCPWADPVLHDRETFEIRYEEFPGGHWWDEEVKEWRAEVYDDLWERVFLPEQEMAGGGEWEGTMGPVEAALHRELQRRWLLWRDEVVREGTTDPDAVRRELAGRQAKWERTRHPGLRGKTPVQAVRAERKKRR
jgi:hypothetical protein